MNNNENIINKYHINLLVNNHSLNYYQRTRAHGRADCRVGKGRVKRSSWSILCCKNIEILKIKVGHAKNIEVNMKRAGTIWITTQIDEVIKRNTCICDDITNNWIKRFFLTEEFNVSSE